MPSERPASIEPQESQPNVIKVGPKDAARLQAIQQSAVEHASGVLLNPEKWADMPPEEREELLRDPNTVFFVAERDGVFIGMVRLFKALPTQELEDKELQDEQGEVWKIGSVYTMPEFRGQGITPTLINRAIEEARARGAARVGLITQTHLDAVKLYQSLGFEAEETYIDTNDENKEKVHMYLNLQKTGTQQDSS